MPGARGRARAPHRKGNRFRLVSGCARVTQCSLLVRIDHVLLCLLGTGILALQFSSAALSDREVWDALPVFSLSCDPGSGGRSAVWLLKYYRSTSVLVHCRGQPHLKLHAGCTRTRIVLAFQRAPRPCVQFCSGLWSSARCLEACCGPPMLIVMDAICC